MNDIALRPITAAADHARLAALAREIWHEHYAGLISRAQIAYMLERGYSPHALAAEQRAGTRFVLAEREAGAVGFAAVSPDPADSAIAWLDKLYVHAAARGRGLGGRLVADSLGHARHEGATRLRLRVNRDNAGAIDAYRRLGFAVEAEDVKDIGGGFVMDDYLMGRPVGAA